MNEEKVKYIDLPYGSKFRRVEETEDGRTRIFYEPSTTVIPKPEPLIGGTEVYQKDNGTPYWYCRIKDGRDEFMHVYFEELMVEDLLFDSNGTNRKFETKKQENFRHNVWRALTNKPKEGYRWIPVYEPSLDANDNLCFVAENTVLRKLSCDEWESLFTEYSPVNESRMASRTTYFLLLLRWLKDGVATLEQLADNSREIGHYCDSENAKHNYEETGEREFGGLYGFVGNTNKILKTPDANSGFSVVGGNYYGNGFNYPLAYVNYPDSSESPRTCGVGLLELTK